MIKLKDCEKCKQDVGNGDSPIVHILCIHCLTRKLLRSRRTAKEWKDAHHKLAKHPGIDLWEIAESISGRGRQPARDGRGGVSNPIEK